MSATAGGRIAFGPSRLSIRDFPLLGGDAEPELRTFLDRSFCLREVRSIQVDPRRRRAEIRCDPVGDPAGLWQRLGRALRLGQDEGLEAGRPAGTADRASTLFLGSPGPIRVSRVGETLTTFRVRLEAPGLIRIGHPLVRRRRDVRFRLEEELAAYPGIRSLRTDRLTADVTVRLDGGGGADQLVHELELAWPRLLHGFDGPPSARRLAVAGGLLALSAAGTFVAPALLPVAVAAIALNGLPTVFRAVRQLARGRVGLPALQATGLVFFLLRGIPLASALMATLTQLWPTLTRDRAIAIQRRLLAPYRRRSRFAWLLLEGGEAVEVPADRLEPGDRVLVRRGDAVPADGTIERGLAATADAAATAAEPVDKETGDAVRAGEMLLDGEIVVQVQRPAARSTAALVEAQLPHGLLAHLPALDEAERVANRNAQPALALALYVLAARRMVRPAQGVIRPDYATAPRLGVQLAAQQALVEALRAGVLFRRPAALDRIGRAEVLVLDDSAPLVGRPLEISRLVTSGVSDTEVLAYAAAAFDISPLGAAMARRAPTASGIPAGPIRRRAGSARYQDGEGRDIEVTSAASLTASGVAAERPSGAIRRSIWVLRDGQRLGRIDFRDGPALADRAAVEQLRAAAGRSVRIIHLSGRSRSVASRLGDALGADAAIGGLGPEEKARLIAGLDEPVAWIGDGTLAGAGAAIAASHVSLSTAAASEDERADGLLLAGLPGAATALAVARAYRAAVTLDYRIVYAVNLAAVAGALAAGFGGTNAGLVSNAGTAIVYARHLRGLARLERDQWQRARAALKDYTL